MTATATASCGGYTSMEDQSSYGEFLSRMRERFATFKPPFFTTDANSPGGDGLFLSYLRALPEEHRQHFTCHSCRAFMRKFGSLVTIGDDGQIMPIFWGEEESDDWHGTAIRALHRRVRKARVTGVFVTKDDPWGYPKTEDWQHMSVFPNVEYLYRQGVLTTGQRMAELKEDYRTLSRGLAKFQVGSVQQALKLFKDGSMYREERFDKMAAWLLELHEARKGLRGKAQENVVWRAVGTAPPGFAHFHNTVLGTVLEDIEGGASFAELERRYKKKMDPLKYQRPQAAPKEGAIKQANKIVDQLKTAGALDRRFARLEDVKMVWVPTPTKIESDKKGGVFDHLKPKEGAERDVVGIPTVITWDKFSRTVLPDALSIDFQTPHRSSYIALVTAVNPDAPPIIQWDLADDRNPMTWYVYAGGSTTSAWNLQPHAWVPVVGITTLPPTWSEKYTYDHAGNGAILLLEGAKDMKAQGSNSGMGFFPEQLRSEYREVRSVMEAYARKAQLADADRDDLACGLDLRRGNIWSAVVRVRTKLGTSAYTLDRWD